MQESSNFDDMSEYLQTFLDETEEQLDDLVETMLSLEQASDNTEDLNEAFRLIHSIKGAAGMMGIDQITILTHHLETRFERFRSGAERLDEPTMNLVLRSIDFFRQCNDRLRSGETLDSPNELLEEIKRLEDQPHEASTERSRESGSSDGNAETVASSLTQNENDDAASADTVIEEATFEEGVTTLSVHFREGLMLADLKARLIVNRLSAHGMVQSTSPELESLGEDEPLPKIEIRLETDQPAEHLRGVAEVDGVESVEIIGAVERNLSSTDHVATESPASSIEATQLPTDSEVEETREADLDSESHSPAVEDRAPEVSGDFAGEGPDLQSSVIESTDAGPPATQTPNDDAGAKEAAQQDPTVPSREPTPASDKPASKLAETMRVDISRLDHLMNLTGELVVNRARFTQISEQIGPGQRETGSVSQLQEFAEKLRASLRQLEGTSTGQEDLSSVAKQIREGLEMIEEHSQSWEHDRKSLERFDEAINQLSRVSQGLQKGVLDTRMVPVGPLFNRFRRVVRDLSKERGKQVELKIRGEKTELDKRMIDELGDPLMHLIRNAVDHGMELPDTRVASGKPESGTITLEATHSGNNVFISISDDGAGINLQKIKDKLVAKRILSETAINELSDDQVLAYIWHPGFSTAKEVTDISGRGVGMDVVQDRIRQLNGNVEVESSPGQGTKFTIRLPLTLAIIHCLLVRMRGVVFAMPIADVREIVSIGREDIINVSGKRAFEVREEFLPLVDIEDIFLWSQSDVTIADNHQDEDSADDSYQVVILQTAGKTMGLCVEEFLGSQDMVIKSLSDNFIDIRGLSGASILGDGGVCLMLDVGTSFHLVTQRSLSTAS